MEVNAIVRHNFFTFSGLHSISTCCALLRFTLGSISGWWSQSERQRSATSSSHLLAAGVVSPAPLCTIFPRNQPSRARTNARIGAPRMPKRSFLNFSLQYLRRSLRFTSSRRCHLLSFQCIALQTFPQIGSFSIHLYTRGRIAIPPCGLGKLSQPATRRAFLTHFEIFERPFARDLDPLSVPPASSHRLKNQTTQSSAGESNLTGKGVGICCRVETSPAPSFRTIRSISSIWDSTPELAPFAR